MLVEIDHSRNSVSTVKSSGHIGSDIFALRRSCNWTLSDLAEELDRSVGWLSQVERDVTEPALDDIRKNSALFNLPVGFFLTAPANQDEQHHIVRPGLDG